MFRGTQKILIHLGLWRKFYIIEFLHIWIALNIKKLTYIFNIHKNMQTAEYGTNSIHNLSTGPHKAIRIYEWLFVQIVESSFPVILCSFKIVILKNTIRWLRIYSQCTGLSKIDLNCSFLHGILS